MPKVTAVLISLLVLGIALAVAGCGSPPAASPPEVETTQTEAESVLDLTGLPVLGQPDAPITVVEFGDFACPFCSIFALETKPLIEENFIETGLVRFAWRDFPIITDRSWAAAHAGQCAHEQNAFWPYHDGLYETLTSRGSEAFTSQQFLSLAGQVDLDEDTFEACMAAGRHEDAIATDMGWAQSLNLSATPAFLVNQYLVIGAQPYEAWQEIFSSILAEQDG